jgi:hypothetical protein
LTAELVGVCRSRCCRRHQRNGSFVFDEKGIHEREFGTLHLGIGKGITFGSTIRAVGPIDLVIRLPIVEVDGRGVLKERYVPV